MNFDFLKSNKWYVSANGGISMSGEFVRSGSWAATRRINKNIIYRVTIHGRRTATSFGLKPYSWWGNLEINGTRYEVPTTHPSCKSINDALFYADRDLTPEVFENICARFYTDYLRVVCVSKVEGDDLIPFCSFFQRPKWVTQYYFGEWERHVPLGTYIEAKWKTDWDGNIEGVQYTKTTLDYWSLSGQGTDLEFQHWLP